MKALLACTVLVAGIAPALAAETWVCTFPGIISPVNVRERFEVRATGDDNRQAVRQLSQVFYPAYLRIW